MKEKNSNFMEMKLNFQGPTLEGGREFISGKSDIFFGVLFLTRPTLPYSLDL